MTKRNIFIAMPLSALPLRLILVVSALLMAGCPSFLVQGRARPLEPGRMQLQVTPLGTGVLEPSGIPAVMPGLELGVRRGISERVELGARLWLGGVTVDGKVALRRSPNPDEGIDWAINPALGYGTQGIGTVGISTGVHSIDLHLPLLVGFNFKGGYGLVLGPRIVQRITVLASPGAPTSYALIAGSSVGFDWPLTEQVHLFPEIALYVPVVAASSHAPVSSTSGDGLGFQIAVGVLMGGH